MSRAVRFDRYGGLEVLRVVDVDRPVPAPGQALVRVQAAGINPGEALIREGALHSKWPAQFPSGQGSDFAGIVEATGAGVTRFKAGDEVLGFTNHRASHAEHLVVAADQLVVKPANVSWEQAGGLFVAGTTAYAAVRSVEPRAGETVVVAGAAGGVGSIAVQLARRAGARVIGLASPGHHEWLTRHGVIPLAYGDGVADRIREASEGRVDAFLDAVGHGYVEIALGLGVAPSRVDTLIDFAAAAKHGVKTAGNSEAATAEVLAELAGLVSAGALEIPIAAVYRLDDVRDAYRRLAQRHTHGKIVLVP